MKKNRFFMIVMAIILAIALMPSYQAIAGGRKFMFTGPGGKSGSRSVEHGMTSNGYQRNVTATSPAGQSVSHGSTTTYDSTQGITTNVTGPGGNNTIINTQGTRGSHGSGTRNTTVTGASGNTATRSVDHGMTSEGYNRTTTSTGIKGRSFSHSTTRTISK